MILKLSPIACAPAAQAVAVAEFGPRAPVRMETCPAARLTMADGMKKGETRFGLRQSSNVRVRSPEIADPAADIGTHQVGIILIYFGPIARALRPSGDA